MSQVAKLSIATRLHPLDLAEETAQACGWIVQRSAPDELHVYVSGQWCDADIALDWDAQSGCLALLCLFGIKTPRHKRAELLELLVRINAQARAGHFDLWPEDGAVLFRHALLLAGAAPTPAQCEAMIRLAAETCELYYLTFQCLLWGGSSIEDALAASMPTQGHA